MGKKGRQNTAMGISILGGALEGFAAKEQLEMKADSAQRALNTLDDRGDMLLAALSNKEKKIVAKQQATFLASGVEVSGSALDVIIDTMSQAHQERIAASMDLQAQKTQLAIEAAVAESNSKFAVLQGMLGAAQDYAMFQTKARIQQEALESAGKNLVKMQEASEDRRSERAQKVKTRKIDKRREEADRATRGIYA
jgi:hypothetical protein